MEMSKRLVEEQLARKDLVDNLNAIVQEWGKRLLLEELSLGNKAYKLNNLRILSIFLESDVLNVSLCAYAELNLDSTKLNSILRDSPRTDYEFTEWDFLELRPMELLKEMTSPGRLYHPSSEYRMLMILLKQFGVKALERALPLAEKETEFQEGRH